MGKNRQNVVVVKLQLSFVLLPKDRKSINENRERS